MNNRWLDIYSRHANLEIFQPCMWIMKLYYMYKHVFISNLVNALLIQKLGLLSFLRMELEKTGLNPKWLHFFFQITKLNNSLCEIKRYIMWLKCSYRFHNLLHYIQFYIGTSRWHHSNMCRYYDMDYFHMRWQLKRELKIFKRTIYITSWTWVGDFLVKLDINISWPQVIFS